MKTLDYIIVGGGFAGLFFAHQLIKNNKSFLLISDRKQAASEVAGGIINPIVLNRFTSFWLGKEQLSFLKETMGEIKEYLESDYLLETPVYRIIHNENEKQTWSIKSKSDELSSFLSSEFIEDSTVTNPFGIGVVHQSGRFAVNSFFNDFYKYLSENNLFLNSTFDFDKLYADDSVYDSIHYKKIVFAEGIRVLQNPYFSFIPIVPSKGHRLVVKLSEPITENVIFKKKYFLFQQENGLYYTGGTYEKNTLEDSVQESSVQDLKESVEEIYPYPFTIESVAVGVRPTLVDRKPTLGNHKEYNNIFVLNGMGTRGVLNGCYFANELFQFSEYGIEFLPEINIERFFTF